MEKEEEIEVFGKVSEVCKAGNFRVELTVGDKIEIILARLSGKMRKNSIRVVRGDNVTVALSPYDLTKGRIIHRS